MRDRTGFGLAAILAALSLSAFAAADGAPRFQILTTLPVGAKVRQTTFNSDYRHYAYLLLKSKTDKRAVVDGRPGAAFDFIGGVTFSPDGKHWAHAGMRGSRQMIVLDGREQEAFDYVGTDVHFSPDGRHVFYYARKGPDQFIVTDGKRGAAFDEIRGTSGQADFYFSDDGRRYAYAARKGKRWFTVIDGVPGEAYDEVSQITGFSPDARHAVSLGRRGKKRWAIVDGKAREIGEYDIAALPAVSSDGRHVAFFAKKGGRVFVVADGKESPGADSAYGIQFAADDQRLIYMRIDGKERSIVDGGLVGPPFHGSGYPRVGPRGRILEYVAEERGWAYPFVNGRRGANYDLNRVGTAEFSLDGAHVAFVAQRYGRWLLVVDGHEIVLPGPPAGFAWLPLLSFNSKSDEIDMALRLGRDVVRAAIPVPRS